MSIQKIKTAASGIEKELLQRAGIPSSAFSGKHQPCPCCGGEDRFQWNIRGKHKDLYNCRGCGGGDWISLLNKYQQIPMNKTFSWLENELGIKDMDVKKKEELELRARRREQVMKLKADLKDENQNWDFNIKAEIDELIYLIGQRGHEKMLRLEEIAQMRRASQLIIKRMANVMTSTSFRRARQIHKSLKEHSGAVSMHALNYANDLKNNDVFDYGDVVFDIMCVREMLIDKKDKTFISQVLKALHSSELQEVA